MSENHTTTSPRITEEICCCNNRQVQALQCEALKSSVSLHHPMPMDTIPSWSLQSIFSSSNTSKLISNGLSNGLSSCEKERLQDFVEPILEGLRALDPEELLQLQRINAGGATLRDGIQVLPIHDKIQPPTATEEGNIVRYVHLNEVPDQYSMGIFIFPPFARIPLHDHPEMCVISRVLYGELHRNSLDLPRDSIECDKSHSSWTSWSPTWTPSLKGSKQQISSPTQDNVAGVKRALRNSNDFLQAPDVTCLFPFEGNLHEFVAGPNGAAVLDVLLPPYDGDNERDCTFYEIREMSAAQKDSFDASTGTSVIDRTRLCWIVPTGQPEDFHCISGQYLGMGRSN